MGKSSRIIAVLVAIVALCGLVRGARRLEIEGNRAFGRQRLYREMSVKKRQLASSDSLGPALHRLASFYRRQGFIQARVEYVEEGSRDSSRIRIFIDEGPRYLIRSLNFIGNDSLPAKVLKRRLKSGPGRPYNPEGIAQDEFNLILAYADYGYIFAAVQNSIETSLDHTVSLTFVINQGRRARLGKLRVNGRSFVDSAYIQRSSGLFSGEFYSRSRMIAGEMNLISSGLFHDAKITTGAVSPDSQLLDLEISVSEKPRHRFEAGLGYGSGDAFRLTARWLNRNVSGWGQRLEFVGLTAVQLWRDIRLVRARAQVSYRDPWLFRKELPGQASLYYDDHRPPYTDYRLQTIGFDLDLIQRLGHGAYVDWRVSQQWLRLSPNWRDPGLPSDTIKYHGRRSLFSGWYLNRLDDQLSPRRGFSTQIDGEYTGGIFGGMNTFQRINYTWIGYYTLAKPRTTIACRLRGGIIGDWNKRNPVPYYERYFLGGPTTLRGYSNGQAGKLTENGWPPGGKKMLLVNLEARPVIYGRWAASLFLDVGMLSDNLLRKMSLSEACSSPGLGLRYFLPIGTGRLDFSAPSSGMGYLKNWKVIVAWGEVF